MKDQEYWEYHIQKLEEIRNDRYLDEHLQQMNFQGERGWECFHIRQNVRTDSDNKNEIYYYFRRPKVWND